MHDSKCRQTAGGWWPTPGDQVGGWNLKSMEEPTQLKMSWRGSERSKRAVAESIHILSLFPLILIKLKIE